MPKATEVLLIFCHNLSVPVRDPPFFYSLVYFLTGGGKINWRPKFGLEACATSMELVGPASRVGPLNPLLHGRAQIRGCSDNVIYVTRKTAHQAKTKFPADASEPIYTSAPIDALKKCPPIGQTNYFDFEESLHGLLACF